jgi:hypothetical protein
MEVSLNSRHLRLPLRRCMVDGCGYISTSYKYSQIRCHLNMCHPELRGGDERQLVDSRVESYLGELMKHDQHCFGDK